MNAPDKDQPVLSVDSTFRFACHDRLPCFTQCCKDVNIYLTPYDVLRLRRALKIGSGEFLAKYTRHFLAANTNIPVVQFEMDPKTLRCKLVTEDGCSVYENRPWACRMFPLDLTGREGEYRMIVRKDRCFGLTESRQLTVRE
ncbi:MAG: YkgJ family cysteine cluster protein, partial [Acidobacteriota bacterium]